MRIIININNVVCNLHQAVLRVQAQYEQNRFLMATYNEINRVLHGLMFMNKRPEEELIPDMETGVYIFADEWLLKYGRSFEDTNEADDDTVEIVYGDVEERPLNRILFPVDEQSDIEEAMTDDTDDETEFPDNFNYDVINWDEIPGMGLDADPTLYSTQYRPDENPQDQDGDEWVYVENTNLGL